MGGQNISRSKAAGPADIRKAGAVYSALRRTRPATKRDLKNYVRVFLGIDIGEASICPEHGSPLDYLWHSFQADFATERKANADAIVWANRGGGKTELAAIATLLDSMFKAGCQVRILGGSGEQAGRMYDYLRGFFCEGFDGFLAGPIRKDRCRFINGSSVEVLTQSAASVRGQHIQKLRCDEVELFDRQVFEAAKYTTQSRKGLLAGMEVISTMHRPYGLMQEQVSSAAKRGVPVFKWCIWEVIEKCRDRSCSRCLLLDDCQGKAKEGAGFLKIDDCITQMRRASRASWEAEMLCRKPSLENVVFDEFDARVHVKEIDYDANLALYRAIDFGFVNPFVCLWVQVDGEGCVRVIDEYVRNRATIDVHAVEIKARTPVAEEQVAASFCDPAGVGVNDVSGTSAVSQLRSLGIRTKRRRSGILEGIELIRRAIKAGDGKNRLVISGRCVRLIEALVCYHYPDNSGRNGQKGELPVKDGVYDHPIDALRYFFVNYRRSTKAVTRQY